MAYVYAHKKLSDSSLFYIGISNDINYKRAKSINGRSKLWRKIVNKHGFSFYILHDNISFNEAKDLERFYVNKYGRIDLKNGCLCNMTDGGEGKVGYITSEDTRRLMSQSKSGTILSRKTKDSISKSKQKIVVNLLNGIFYESAQEAAYYNSIKSNTLYSYLSGQRNNKTDLIYI